MSSYGWTNDHTWGVAGACDNTVAAVATVQSIIDTARGGQIDEAAHALRDAVVNRNLLDGTLPSWVDLAAVNWTELVQGWAADAP
jgi:hypothetical protein